MMKNSDNDIFILQKSIGKYKKGKKFCAFGGLVFGINITGGEHPTLIYFSNRDYFKLQKSKT